MKVKLIKVEDVYRLLREDNLIIGTTDYEYQKAFSDHCYKLSIKNCQAIERGYDLDELAEKFGKEEAYGVEFNGDLWKGYIFGFQKALELMKHRLVEETEWQVEVLMDICGDKVYAVPEPVLDEQGYLILKRIDN